MIVVKGSNKQNLLVALKSGEIRMYSTKALIDKLQTEEVCNGIAFGTFGKQEGSLIVNFKSGGLTFKSLIKNAKLQ